MTFPFIPEGWTHDRLYAIQKGSLIIHFYAGGKWGVEVIRVAGRAMLDKDGKLHLSVRGYKLHSPPLFDDFSMAVATAIFYTGNAEVAHQDTVLYGVAWDDGLSAYCVRYFWNGEAAPIGVPTYATYAEANKAKTRKSIAHQRQSVARQRQLLSKGV